MRGKGEDLTALRLLDISVRGRTIGRHTVVAVRRHQLREESEGEGEMGWLMGWNAEMGCCVGRPKK
jgi:hypothetical protein